MRMRVLVIEDTDSIRKMIETIVTARGFQVQSAASGTDGFAQALAWHPDVVVLDIHLPGSVDGFGVCANLRAHETTARVPIIMISAAHDDDVRKRAAECGANAFYGKPFSPLALLREIEQLLTGSAREA